MKPTCTKCGKIIKSDKTLYLELDQRDGKYYACGTVPPEHSQGAFPFGPDCIIKQYKKEHMRSRR